MKVTITRSYPESDEVVLDGVERVEWDNFNDCIVYFKDGSTRSFTDDVVIGKVEEENEE